MTQEKKVQHSYCKKKEEKEEQEKYKRSTDVMCHISVIFGMVELDHGSQQQRHKK